MDGFLGLSFQEWNILRLYAKSTGSSSIANIGFTLDFQADSSSRGVYALAEAVKQFAARNEGARVVIREEKNSLSPYVQEILPSSLHPGISLISFTDRDISYKAFLRKCWLRSFEMGKSVCRFAIAVFENGAYSLIAAFDHVNSDQEALSIAASQIRQLHDCILSGAPLPAAPPSFQDFLKRQLAYMNGSHFASDRAFWDSYYDRIQESSFSLEPGNEVRCQFQCWISQTGMKGLRGLAAKLSVSFELLWLALYSTFIFKYLHTNTFYITTRYMNRFSKEDKKLFANCHAELPVLISVEPDMDFTALCSELLRESVIVQRHGRYPLLTHPKSLRAFEPGSDLMLCELRLGLGTDEFEDIRDVFSPRHEDCTDWITEGWSLLADRNGFCGVDMMLNKKPRGDARVDLVGVKECFPGLESFQALLSELIGYAKKLDREGDMTIERLIEEEL